MTLAIGGAPQTESGEYARALALERENQALQEQIRDYSQLLQMKDSEIMLKHHLLQAQERENIQMCARLQWLELTLNQKIAEADAAKKFVSADGTVGRSVLLSLNPSRQAHRLVDGPPPELANLTCKKESEVAAEFNELEDLQTPSKEGRKGSTPAPSPTAAGSSGASSKRIRRGGRNRNKSDGTADEDSAKVDSPKQQPPPLELLSEPDSCASSKHAEETIAEKTMSTPSKRLAIVDPVSGKQIEVTPSTEGSRIQPTLISLDTISGGSRASPCPPLSPAGPGAPPLTLPPVVAGTNLLSTAPSRPPPPQLGAAMPPLPFGGFPAAGLRPPIGPPLPPPLLGGQMPGLPLGGSGGAPLPPYPPGIPLSGYPAPAPTTNPGPMTTTAIVAPPCPPPAHQAPCPPPSHPAPALGEAWAIGGKGAVATGPSVVASGVLSERLADGGAIQMARGPLAAVGSGPLLGQPPPIGTPIGPPLGAPAMPPPQQQAPQHPAL